MPTLAAQKGKQLTTLTTTGTMSRILRGCRFCSRVHTIKYQSKIFSRGLQNCPRIWNWSTGDRGMNFWSTIFFKHSFLHQIAAVWVHIIKYQSKIFSRGFQNCPQIWNWSTKDRVMNFSSTIFFKCSFLRQIAAVRVHIIKYQSKIFSQGFQNCPWIWNWSTGDRVMALPAPFFSSAHFYVKSPPNEYIL